MTERPGDVRPIPPLAPGMDALPTSLVANPRLSTWVRLDPDGTLSLRPGKVELGQGIATALAQLAADELDLDPAQVRMLPASTAGGPDEGPTAGSMSVADSGAAVRQVCAQLRVMLLEAAGAHLEADPSTLVVRDGIVRVAGGALSVSYGDLAAGLDLDRDAGPPVPLRRGDDLRLTGAPLDRVDLPAKVRGEPRFITDLVLPGQLWGRVVRPPSPAAVLDDVDLAAVRAEPGVVEVVRDGSFLGVVATDERLAGLAAERLRASATWHERPTLPDEHDLSTYLRAGPSTTFDVDVTAPADGAAGPVVVRTITATYARPFLAHASMSPSCGVAWWDEPGETVRVWSHSQAIFGLQRAITAVLGVGPAAVVVEHAEGAGAYGHNGADDAALDAVLLARAVPGRPVHVRWSRSDELTWAPLGSAMELDITAGVDADGRLASWSTDVWSQGHTSRPGSAGTPSLLAAAHLADPVPLPTPVDPAVGRGAGSTRNAVPPYAVPVRTIRGHRLERVALRSSSLRTLGAFGNVLAIESMIDEVALEVGADPLAYRLAHLDDERGRAVLLAAAEQAGWASRPTGGDVGLGIGYSRYKGRGARCAVVAEVEAVHEIRVRRLVVAVDVGRVVNPDGVRNQLEGGAVQSTSWVLKEQVRFDRVRLTSSGWDTYPVLRFGEVPRVEVLLLDHPDEPSVGAGEASQGPAAAAVLNAVAAALGVRVRRLPLTPDRVAAALDE